MCKNIIVIVNMYYKTGGKDSIPFKTYSQVASAEGMSLIAKEQKSQFILAL